jgi:hypothetical protein
MKHIQRQLPIPNLILPGLELMDRYQNLHKDIEYLKEWKRNFVDMREAVLFTGAQLSCRQKQLISELSFIYPIVQVSVLL